MIKKLLDKVRCFFGFHTLIESEEEMKLLREALKDPFARAIGLGHFSDGTPVVFRVCTRCGAKR